MTSILRRLLLQARIIPVMLLLLVVTLPCTAQDIRYARMLIDSLASPSFHGRGYVAGGDRIAAAFIARQLQQHGAKPFGEDYFQHFHLSINSFPGALSLSLDRKVLRPGSDFMVALSSSDINGKYPTLWLNKNSFSKQADINKFLKTDLWKTILILDTGFVIPQSPHLFTAKAILVAVPGPLSWNITDGAELSSCPIIYVARDKIPSGCRMAGIEIENRFLKNYRSQNVIGYIPGTSRPDSFIVFTAHYDHLGRMGADTYFPGAHDNASGCAMALDLARHYSMPENRSAYSIAFIFPSAEEAGLIGSGYYVNNPLFPLENIKFLINLDMESTGSEGLKVVNGTIYPGYLDLLARINEKENLLKKISPRGVAANSDHYRFHKKGVPCFYVYTLGDEWKEYHTPDDKAEGLPLTKYNELFRLITLFTGALEDSIPY